MTLHAPTVSAIRKAIAEMEIDEFALPGRILVTQILTLIDTLELAEKVRGDWRLIESAPKDGTRIKAKTADGDIDDVSWQAERYCMLGAPQGSCGPGWLSHECSLPVDDNFTHWRPQ